MNTGTALYYRLVVEAGVGGVTNLVLRFHAEHPDVSKRQIEMKIGEIGEKEKRAEDTFKVWHMKPEFEYLLSTEMQSKVIPMDVVTASTGKYDMFLLLICFVCEKFNTVYILIFTIFLCFITRTCI